LISLKDYAEACSKFHLSIIFDPFGKHASETMIHWKESLQSFSKQYSTDIEYIIQLASFNQWKKVADAKKVSENWLKELNIDKSTVHLPFSELTQIEIKSIETDKTGKTEYDIGLSFFENEKIESSIELFKASGRKNYPLAFLKLYRIYDNNGLFSNPKKARKTKIESSKYFEWFKDQTKSEDSNSQFIFGFCYYREIGTKKNLKEAIFW
jgi:TPR repeat protein